MDLKEKILLVVPDGLENAGVQNVVMNLVRTLKDRYEFDMMTFRHRGTFFEKEFLDYGGKIFSFPKYEGQNSIIRRGEVYYRWLKNSKKVRKVIKENGPYKAVHCHNDVESGYILKVAYKQHIPVRIIHTHVNSSVSGHIFRKMLNYLFVRQINRYSTNKIGCSEESLLSLFGEIANSRIIRNPYQNHRFYYDSTKEKPSDCLKILQIGSYSENKNQKFTLDVFQYIHEQEPTAELRFVGFENQPGYFIELKEKVRGMNLTDSVTFLPHDTATEQLLRDTSYLLFPSFKEGFGMVLIEAQATGVRCFASDSVPRETDCGGVTYLDLSSGAKEWAEIILNDYRRSGGEHGNFDCSCFSSETVAEEIAAIYEGVKSNE